MTDNGILLKNITLKRETRQIVYEILFVQFASFVGFYLRHFDLLLILTNLPT